MNFFGEQILTHRPRKTYSFQMRRAWGWGDVLRVWDRNAVKFGCEDCCTTINVINALSNKKRYTEIRNCTQAHRENRPTR